MLTAQPIETRSFSEIWEQSARWLYGPALLGKIVDHLRGRAVELEAHPANPHALVVSLPVPTVRDEITGRHVPLIRMIPPELQAIYVVQQGLVLATRVEDIKSLDQLISRPNTPAVIADGNAALAAKEEHRGAEGGWPLCVVAAQAFGLVSGDCSGAGRRR